MQYWKHHGNLTANVAKGYIPICYKDCLTPIPYSGYCILTERFKRDNFEFHYDDSTIQKLAESAGVPFKVAKLHILPDRLSFITTKYFHIVRSGADQDYNEWIAANSGHLNPDSKIVEQLREKYNLSKQDISVLFERKELQYEILKTWYSENFLNPFPDLSGLYCLAKVAQLRVVAVMDWLFQNISKDPRYLQ